LVHDEQNKTVSTTSYPGRQVLPMEFLVLLTVFTPTLNRRHTLLRLFESLEAQTFRDFEGLLADDGSTEGTGEFVPTGIAGMAPPATPLSAERRLRDRLTQEYVMDSI